MSDFKHLVIWLSLYKIAGLTVGLLFAYFGYRLFSLGFYHKAGELKVAWGERNLTLKQTAPGTFFVLFGAGVICATLWRGVDLEQIAKPPEPVVIVSLETDVPMVDAPEPARFRKDNPPVKERHETKAYEKSLTPGKAKSQETDPVKVQSFPELLTDESNRMVQMKHLRTWFDGSAIRPIIQRLHAGVPLDKNDLNTLKSWENVLQQSKIGPVVKRATMGISLTEEDRTTLEDWLNKKEAIIEIHGIAGRFGTIDSHKYLALDISHACTGNGTRGSGTEQFSQE